MEELHRIHKDVPFGYWALWVAPALKALARHWNRADAERRALKQALTLR
ncbi:MAG: hypothetical protein AB1942_23250 [Pseudomonadota bacterium]